VQISEDGSFFKSNDPRLIDELVGAITEGMLGAGRELDEAEGEVTEVVVALVEEEDVPTLGTTLRFPVE
jgi:hypothetical protein